MRGQFAIAWVIGASYIGCSLTNDLDDLRQTSSEAGSGDGGCVPRDESCNGKDDDCDGLVDDGFGQLSCGKGACSVVIDACEKGKATTCVPWSSRAEDCDGLDNDCDGVIDNGCACHDGDVQDCYSGAPDTKGVGACKSGKQTCSGGVWNGACVGEALPQLETCNGVDDDCDGSSDEGLNATGYADADDDGFGTGPAMQFCTGASGVASNADDCYDANPNAHPGQTEFFSQDRGDGSFDYDCDGKPVENLSYGAVTQIGSWGQPSTNTASWYGMQKTAVFAVRFVPSQKVIVKKFASAHQRTSGATGTLGVILRADAGGIPGSTLETSTSSVDISSFATWTSSPTSWSVTFAGDTPLQAGKAYWLVARITSSNQGDSSANIIIPLIQNTYDDAFLSAGAGETKLGSDADGVDWFRNYRFPWTLEGQVVSGGGSFH